jgi:hypothetical protein
MTFLEAMQNNFVTWMNGLTAADNVLIAAIGLGLIIFSVVALLAQNYFKASTPHPRNAVPQKKTRVGLPGVLHSRDFESPVKAGAFSMKTKSDPFLSRLERL